MAKSKGKAKPKAKAKTRAKRPSRTGVLHRKALRHNWDGGPPEDIVGDPACDLGTALAIYWMGAPGFDQQFAKVGEVDSWRRPVFRFLRALEKRLLERDFATARLLFNPRFDRTTISEDGHDWTAEYGDVKVRRPIPEALEAPSAPDPAWEARRRAPVRKRAGRPS